MEEYLCGGVIHANNQAEALAETKTITGILNIASGQKGNFVCRPLGAAYTTEALFIGCFITFLAGVIWGNLK